MEFNRLIPSLKVSDITKSLEFYTKILGFKIEYERQEEKFVFLSYQGSQLMVGETGAGKDWITAPLEAPLGRGINFQIETDNLSVLLEALQVANYPLFAQVHEKWYREVNILNGNRQFLVQDPDGYLLRFFEDLGTKPASTPSSS